MNYTSKGFTDYRNDGSVIKSRLNLGGGEIGSAGNIYLGVGEAHYTDAQVTTVPDFVSQLGKVSPEPQSEAGSTIADNAKGLFVEKLFGGIGGKLFDFGNTALSQVNAKDKGLSIPNDGGISNMVINDLVNEQARDILNQSISKGYSGFQRAMMSPTIGSRIPLETAFGTETIHQAAFKNKYILKSTLGGKNWLPSSPQSVFGNLGTNYRYLYYYAPGNNDTVRNFGTLLVK